MVFQSYSALHGWPESSQAAMSTKGRWLCSSKPCLENEGRLDLTSGLWFINSFSRPPVPAVFKTIGICLCWVENWLKRHFRNTYLMARQEVIGVIHGAVIWPVADTQSMGGCKGRAHLMYRLDSKDRSQRWKLKFGVSWQYHHQGG